LFSRLKSFDPVATHFSVMSKGLKYELVFAHMEMLGHSLQLPNLMESYYFLQSRCLNYLRFMA